MKIVDCCLERFEDIEKYTDMYNIQVKSGSIKPKISYARLDPMEFLTKQNIGFIVASSNDSIKGLLDYVLTGGSVGLYDMEGWYLDKIGLEGYPAGSVAKIERLESFPPRRGTGTLLIQALKEKPGVEAILANSRIEAVEFYQNMGFVDFSPIESAHENPLMIWESKW
jgi:hypothetical protein